MALNNIDFPDPSATPFDDDNGYTWDWVVTKWVRRTQNVTEEAPDDEFSYVRKGKAWQKGVLVDPGASDIIYARSNNGWIEVIDAGTGITDANNDGNLYGRKDAAWAQPVIADIALLNDALDAKANLSHPHVMADITDAGAMALVTDAPDASLYGRSLDAWVPIAPASGIYFSESLTIINPQDTDDATIFFTPVAITLASIHTHIVGAGSTITCNIKFASTRNGSPTEVFTLDKVLTLEAGETLTPNIAGIPVNSWVWLEIVSTIGAPEMVHISLSYTQD